MKFSDLSIWYYVAYLVVFGLAAFSTGWFWRKCVDRNDEIELMKENENLRKTIRRMREE